MICPLCNTEFQPIRVNQVYCCPECTIIAQNARKRAATKARQKERAAWKEPAKGAGVGPLNTRHIQASRRHEAELIDRVVAKAMAKGTAGGIDISGFRRRNGPLKGTRVG